MFAIRINIVQHCSINKIKFKKPCTGAHSRLRRAEREWHSRHRFYRALRRTYSFAFGYLHPSVPTRSDVFGFVGFVIVRAWDCSSLYRVSRYIALLSPRVSTQTHTHVISRSVSWGVFGRSFSKCITLDVVFEGKKTLRRTHTCMRTTSVLLSRTRKANKRVTNVGARQVGSIF